MMKLTKEAKNYLQEIRDNNGDLRSQWVIHALKVKFGIELAEAIPLIDEWEKNQPKLLVE